MTFGRAVTRLNGLLTLSLETVGRLMQTQLLIQLSETSRTSLYALPFSEVDLPPGSHIPQSGERLTMCVLKPQAKREILEPRNFEVAERNTYLHCDPETGFPFRAEVTLVLTDLGSAMPNEHGVGALGDRDPIRVWRGSAYVQRGAAGK